MLITQNVFMSYAILFLDSLQIPYHVMDYAFEWAKEHETGLKAFFIFQPEASSDEYGYPSDIDQAEMFSSDDDALRGMENIFRHEVRLIQKKAFGSHIPFETIIHRSADADQLLAQINQAVVIFADAEKNNDEHDFSASINLADIREKITAPIRHVSRKEVYADDSVFPGPTVNKLA